MIKLKNLYDKFKYSNIFFSVSSLMIFILFSSLNHKTNIFLFILYILINVYYIFKADKSQIKNDYLDYKICIFAGIVAMLGYVQFYHNFAVEKMDPSNEINLFHLLIKKEFVFSYLAVFLIIVGFQYLCVFCLWMKKLIQPLITRIWADKKFFFVLFVIYFFAYFPLIRSFIYYGDDIARMTEGDTLPLTGSFSRYLSNFLITSLEGNKFLADISPLTHILALLIMTLAGILSIYIITDFRTTKWIYIIAVIPACVSPYFAECVSYKYDAPCMALSVLSAVIPLVYWKSNTFRYITATFFGTLFVCTTYQASSGIFPLMVAMLMLLSWNKGETLKNVLLFCGKSALGYGLGIGVFKFGIMESISGTTYVDDTLSLSGFILNIQRYIFFILNRWQIIWIFVLLIIVISFIIVTVISSQRNKLLCFIVTVCTLGFIFIISFGLYIFFSNPSLLPRAFYGFTFAVAIIGVVLVSYENLPILKAPPILLSWLFMVFCIIYGNTITVQRDYESFRKQELFNDLKDIPAFNNPDGKVKLQIKGSFRVCKQVKNVMQEYKMIKYLVINSIDSWPYYEMLNYYDFDNVEIVSEKAEDFSTYKLPVLKDNIYHTISSKDNYVLIEFKELYDDV